MSDLSLEYARTCCVWCGANHWWAIFNHIICRECGRQRPDNDKLDTDCDVTQYLYRFNGACRDWETELEAELLELEGASK